MLSEISFKTNNACISLYKIYKNDLNDFCHNLYNFKIYF